MGSEDTFIFSVLLQTKILQPLLKGLGVYVTKPGKYAMVLTNAFSWLEGPTSAFTLRHYAKCEGSFPALSCSCCSRCSSTLAGLHSAWNWRSNMDRILHTAHIKTILGGDYVKYIHLSDWTIPDASASRSIRWPKSRLFLSKYKSSLTFGLSLSLGTARTLLP